MATTVGIDIVTGATGVAHVSSNDDGEFNQGIWGEGLVVLSNGGKLSATVESANAITIHDGDLVFQGRHALIPSGDTASMTIDNGASGQKRIDLICVQYKRTGSVEEMNLVVKKGTASSGTPTAPSYTTGVIRTGATLAEYPLYKVELDGLSITAVTRMADVMPYGVNILKHRIECGTSLPNSTAGYIDGDIFLVYEA